MGSEPSIFGVRVVESKYLPPGTAFVFAMPPPDYLAPLESLPPGLTRDEKIARALAKGGFVAMAKGLAP